MAIFRVGDRVRKVNNGHRKAQVLVPLGAEGVIVGWDPDGTFEWMVEYPDAPKPPFPWKYHFADSEMLAPLTDPKADAFLESLKRLGREPLVPTKEHA